MIRENRILKKYTQEEFAEKIDISTRQLQRIEKDENSTKISTLKKIIKELDIPDNEILEFIKKK